MMTPHAIGDAAATEEAWHSLPTEALPQRIECDPQAGLTEAEAKRRLGVFIPNVISPIKSESLWRVFIDLIREPLMLLLLGIVSSTPSGASCETLSP
jgi:magnesium-transporting ATPase (P-type)